MRGTHLLVPGSAKGLLSSYLSQPCRTFQSQLSRHLYGFPSLELLWESLGMATQMHSLLVLKEILLRVLKVSWKVCPGCATGICPCARHHSTHPVQDGQPTQAVFCIWTTCTFMLCTLTSLSACGDMRTSEDNPCPTLWPCLAASWRFTPAPSALSVLIFPIR